MDIANGCSDGSGEYGPTLIAPVELLENGNNVALRQPPKEAMGKP